MSAEAVEFLPDCDPPEYEMPTDRVSEALDLIHAATEMLNNETAAFLEDTTDPAAAALLFDRIQQHRKGLQQVEASVEAAAAQRMTSRKIAVPGWVIEKKGGSTNHRWDDAAAAWSVLLPLATVPDTGEVDDAAAELLGKARDQLLQCAHVDYWRIEAMKDAGETNPYRFRTSEKGRYTIRVTKTEDMQP